MKYDLSNEAQYDIRYIKEIVSKSEGFATMELNEARQSDVNRLMFEG